MLLLIAVFGMEDGEENFEISESNVKSEERDVSREDSGVFKADSKTKITPNNILSIGDCIGDSNGSPSIGMEPEEAEEGEEFHGFSFGVPPVKQNSGTNVNGASSCDTKGIHFQVE